MSTDVSAYCNIDEVMGKTGVVYGAGTQPSSSEATDIMLNVAAEIDGVLASAGYTIPIADTAPISLRLLRHYNTLGAAYQCWHAGFKGGSTPAAVQAWERDYRKFIEDIKDDKIRLPDVAEASSNLRYNAVFRVNK